MPDLVVFLPGITGSTLARSGRLLWGPALGPAFGALFRRSLDQLSIPAESADEDLGDGVAVGELMRDVHLVPGLWKIDGYSGFEETLCARLELRSGAGFLPFAYDWRRDNRVSARRLERVAMEALGRWRRGDGGEDAKLVLVAHSMGGLVARYFMEVLGGWRDTRQMITLGTPFRGSVNAAGFLSNGFAKRIGPFSLDATSVLRSFASVHQLLPTYRCVDLGDGTLVRIDEAALPDVDPRKVADALLFHQEMEEAARRNQGIEGYRSRVNPVLSSGQPTFQSIRLEEGKAVLRRHRDGNDEGGDGTVPTISAIVPGLDATRGFYVKGIHGSLQTLESVAELVVGQIRGSGLELDQVRAASEGSGTVRLALDDAYASHEPIPLRARVVDATEQRLDVVATDASGGQATRTTLWPSPEGFEGEVRLGPGIWRITVGGQRSEPTTDLALVADRDAA